MTELSPHELYDPPTVPGMFMHQARRFGDRVLKLSKHDGRWAPTTWREARENLRRATMGLIASGVRKGDRVGIVSRTRAEWSDADLAALTAGAVVVGIYPTASAWEQEHVIRHSGCRLIFVENDAILDKILAIRETVGLPERLVIFETTRTSLPAAVITFADLKRQGHELDLREPGRFDAAWRAVAPADLATIAYTSGTTGPPKGAMITHANLYFTAINAVATQDLDPDDFGIAYLPLTHMLQRMTVYAALHAGIRGVYAESIDKLIDNFRELRPTVQVGVPRVFEKIHARIMERIDEGSPLRRRIFAWAMEVGRRTAPFRKAGRPLPFPACARAHPGRPPRLRKDPGSLRRTGETPRLRRRPDVHGSSSNSSMPRGSSSWRATASPKPSPRSRSTGRIASSSAPSAGSSTASRRSWARETSSSSAARGSSGVITGTPRRPPRRSTPTAGSTRGTSPRSTRRGSSPSPTGRRTSSSPRAGRTSPRRTSKTSSGPTPASARRWSTATGDPT